SLLGFGTAADGHYFVAKLIDEEVMATVAPQQSPSWRSLAVSSLHRLVLEKLLPAGSSCQYVHLLTEVTEAMAAQSCQVAVLVPPVSMLEVEEIAGQRETMPPKSTYFYPKLLTGMVFHTLKKD
ncbi:MAG: DUF1015 domain-containing protein, partial [Gemmataceae bacterium]